MIPPRGTGRSLRPSSGRKERKRGVGLRFFSQAAAGLVCKGVSNRKVSSWEMALATCNKGLIVAPGRPSASASAGAAKEVKEKKQEKDEKLEKEEKQEKEDKHEKEVPKQTNKVSSSEGKVEASRATCLFHGASFGSDPAHNAHDTDPSLCNDETLKFARSGNAVTRLRNTVLATKSLDKASASKEAGVVVDNAATLHVLAPSDVPPGATVTSLPIPIEVDTANGVATATKGASVTVGPVDI